MDMIRPYRKRGPQSECGNSSANIFNQRQLESVLVYNRLSVYLLPHWKTAGIPSQSATNLFLNMLGKLQCIKIESNEMHNCGNMDFQKSEI